MAARAHSAAEWLRRLDPNAADWESQLSVVTSTVADALVHGDSQALHEILDPVRDELARLFDTRGHSREMRGYLLAVLATTRAGLERLPEPFAVQIPTDSHAAAMLQALSTERPLSSQELRDQLGTSPSQISRVGRQLLSSGLVVQRRTGRTASLEITPRGLETARASKRQGRNRRAR
ncbi:MAG TPA: helix-turn-helix domain-containing protein [Solirubrobacteraceae bacterium]|nr:helix-turn-helix domain-containing protein [Solirubrobacteraceae bacterium]